MSAARLRSLLEPREDAERPSPRGLYVASALLVAVGLLVLVAVLAVFLVAHTPGN